MHSLQQSIPIAGVLVMLGIGALLWADEDKPAAPKSAAARTARSQFTAKLSEIQKETETKLAAARKEYADALLKARNEAMRRGDLDEANRIQAEVLGAHKKSLPRPELHPDWTARESLVPKLAGSTWIMGGENRLTLKADGATGPRPDGVGGKWAPIDASSIVVLYDDGWVDLWQIGEGLANAKASHAKLGETPERVRVP